MGAIPSHDLLEAQGRSESSALSAIHPERTEITTAEAPAKTIFLNFEAIVSVP